MRHFLGLIPALYSAAEKNRIWPYRLSILEVTKTLIHHLARCIRFASSLESGCTFVIYFLRSIRFGSEICIQHCTRIWSSPASFGRLFVQHCIEMFKAAYEANAEFLQHDVSHYAIRV